MERLTRAHAIAGKGSNIAALYEASSQATENTRDTVFLQQIIATVEAASINSPLLSLEISALDEMFSQLILSGASVTRNQMNRVSSDGTDLYVETKIIEGSLEHLYVVDTHQPIVTLALYKPMEELRTVLVKGRDGLLESFKDRADGNERLASFVAPEFVVRDEQGVVESIRPTESNERVIIEATRAAGLRKLKSEHLEQFEVYIPLLTT